MINVKFTLFAKPQPGIMTKKINLIDGEIVKDASKCLMNAGNSIVLEKPFKELPKLLDSLEKRYAVAWGISKYEEQIKIVAKSMESTSTDAISRTKENFSFPEKEPGVLMIDNDTGMATIELVAILETVMSNLKGIARIERPSCSSDIYAEGKLLTSEGTGRVYYLVDNAAEIPRIGKTLHQRLILDGHGYIQTTKSGAMLSRSLIDDCVWQAERLDFVAEPDLGKGLKRRAPKSKYSEGTALVTGDINDLTSEELERLEAIVTGLKARKMPEADKIKEQYINDEANKLVTECNISKSDAIEIVQQRTSRNLADNDILYFDDLGDVTVAEVLQDLKTYDQKTLADPLEPDYGGGRCKAIFFANIKNGSPRIHSFAHGGQTYKFGKFDESEKPTLILPGYKDTRLNDCSQTLGELLAETGLFYVREGKLFKITEMGLELVLAPSLCGHAETVANLRKTNKDGDLILALMHDPLAKQMIHNQLLLEAIPEIKNISDCPVLVESNNTVEEVVGYHEPSKVYAKGAMPENMELDEAKKLIDDLLHDFKFVSQADKSRAFALLISPALLHGGLVDARVPMFTIEGNSPGTGKGILANICAAIYNRTFENITNKSGGVGSFDESLGSALYGGKGLTLFDNFRGRLDSQRLESMLTEDHVQVRIPHRDSIKVNVTRNIFVLTSNGVEFTEDLGRRIMTIKLEKQPSNYPFVHDDFPGHVKKNQPKYLGAVFTIIKHWYCQGAKTSGAKLPSFTPWVKVVDYIVTDIMSLPSLLDGNQDAVERMANPARSWLREVALHFIKNEIFDEMTTTGICQEIDGSVKIPGLDEGAVLNDETIECARSATGKQLKKAFGDTDVIQFERIKIKRLIDWDDSGNDKKKYRFTRVSDILEIDIEDLF